MCLCKIYLYFIWLCHDSTTKYLYTLVGLMINFEQSHPWKSEVFSLMINRLIWKPLLLFIYLFDFCHFAIFHLIQTRIYLNSFLYGCWSFSHINGWHWCHLRSVINTNHQTHCHIILDQTTMKYLSCGRCCALHHVLCTMAGLHLDQLKIPTVQNSMPQIIALKFS